MRLVARKRMVPAEFPRTVTSSLVRDPMMLPGPERIDQVSEQPPPLSFALKTGAKPFRIRAGFCSGKLGLEVVPGRMVSSVMVTVQLGTGGGKHPMQTNKEGPSMQGRQQFTACIREG